MTEKKRRDVLRTAAGVTVLGSLAGCSSDDGGTENTEAVTETATGTETESMDEGTETTATGTEAMGEGRLSVAHMSPNAPNVDVYLDGEAVLEALEYTDVSTYMAVPPATYDVAITPEGESIDDAVFEGTVVVEAEVDYTVAALGEVGDAGDKPFEPLVLEDDNSDPGGDSGRVRTVHASPDAPAVDLTASEGAVVLVDGLEYRQTATSTVESDGYTVEVRSDTESNDGEVVYDEDISFNGGSVYTVYATGYLTPDDDPSEETFDLVVAKDASY
ncbi:DUF4397 domain-containing protein [Halobacteriales archaeon QS_4_62_28]|nr:MAG: DUF4397 domain-containing protein [Halobacteriales archaeon QS_4_62_28]